MTDIVDRLRESVRACRALDRSELLEEAAAEIERLRLLPEERCAVERAASFIEGSGWSGQTLRVLLKRLCSDPSAYTHGVSASGESKFSLTDAERASVTRAIETLEGVEYIDAFCSENDATAAAILRGLLERLSPAAT